MWVASLKIFARSSPAASVPRAAWSAALHHRLSPRAAAAALARGVMPLDAPQPVQLLLAP